MTKLTTKEEKQDAIRPSPFALCSNADAPDMAMRCYGRAVTTAGLADSGN